jgi:hypothetical protein
VRGERPGDHEVHRLAFGRDDEDRQRQGVGSLLVREVVLRQ